MPLPTRSVPPPPDDSPSTPARSARRTRLTWAGIGAATATLVGAGALAAADLISGPQRPAALRTFTPYELGLDAEDVAFTARDGSRLAGWWLGHDGKAAGDVVVVSHGHRGSKGEMLGISKGLWLEGFEVLLYDFRGCGESGDGPQSMGLHEQQDLEAALALARERRPRARIHLVGFSLGGAVSIMVAARETDITSVVADSAFADVRGVIADQAPLYKVPRRAVTLVDLATSLRYGYRFREVSPVSVVADIAPRPLLLFHCTGDTTTSVQHAHRLAEAAGPGSELRITDGEEHCGRYFVDRPAYVREVAEFLRG